MQVVAPRRLRSTSTDIKECLFCNRFDAAQLQPYLSSTLTTRLRNAAWDKSDKDKNRALSRSIAEVIKAKMLGG